jgi:formate dehydrogenase assembly factor FdhD
MTGMKNEKPSMWTAIVCASAAAVSFGLGFMTAGGVLAMVAAVATLIFAEARWHNIHQAEIEVHKEALREYHRKVFGEEPPKEGGQGDKKDPEG